jgi:hypothetical protein
VERGLVGSLGTEVVGVEMLGNLEEDRESIDTIRRSGHCRLYSMYVILSSDP